jgi:hypothetical protein
MRERARKIRSVSTYFSLLLSETKAVCEGFHFLVYIELQQTSRRNVS